jgi:single-strand DNA-binding protein
MVNKVILIGNLGRDPEIRRLENNVAVGRFSVATTDSYKDKDGNWQEKTEWHDVVVWHEKAEHAEKFLKKGSTVYVEGKLTHRKYLDPAINAERYITEVMAINCRSLRAPGQSTGYIKSSFPTEEPVHLPAQVHHETPPSMSIPTDEPVKNIALPTIPPIHLVNNGRNTATVAAEPEPEPVGATEGGDNLPF